MSSITQNISVRCLTGAEIGEAYKIHTESQPFPWRLSAFEDNVNTPYQTLGLFTENGLVGYAVLLTVLDEITLMDIAISTECRGANLGTRLMDYLIEKARRDNAAMIWLEVREGNQSAIALYKKFEFELIEKRKDYYPKNDGREDALIMRLMF